ncbi:MAG: hypothetical protein AB1625_01200 [Acidobacteriota bacterium]
MTTRPAGRWVIMAMLWTTVAPAGADTPAPQSRSIPVPEGDGRPILIDGIFTPGEWDDARKVELAPNVELLVKRTTSFVYVGVRFAKPDPRDFHGSVDLLLSSDGTSIRQLHAGAQLGERPLNGAAEPDAAPAFVWGDTRDWVANESRWNERKVADLMEKGKDRDAALKQSMYESDGYEFQIRKSKFAAGTWLLRIRAFVPPGLTREFFPAGTSFTSTAGWFRLRLE